jgi:hypothetical protein
MAFPSTTFASATLPKHFAPHRLEDANNTYTLLEPGVQIHINGPLVGEWESGGWCWRGLRCLGAYSVGVSSYSITWASVLEAAGANQCQFGLLLQNPPLQSMQSSIGQATDCVGVTVAKDITGGGRGFEFWRLTHTGGYQSVGTFVTAATSGSFRIDRTSATAFQGFYNIGAGWVSLGTFSAVDFDYPLSPTIGYHVPPSLGVGQQYTFNVSSFDQLSGSYGLDYSTDAPSDTFDTTHTDRYWIFTPTDAVPRNASETWSISGGKGTLFTGTAPYWDGLTTPWVLFPGTDIEIVADLELTKTGTNNFTTLFGFSLVDAVKNTKAGPFNGLWQSGGTPAGNIGARLAAGILYDSGANNGTVWWVGPHDAWHTSTGYISGLSRAQVKLTRTGNTWSLAYDIGAGWVSLGSPWADSTNQFEWCRLFLEKHQTDNRSNGNIYTLSVTGDYNALGDENPPYLDNQDPAPDATGVLVTTTISTDVLDDTSGVDESTVVLYVNGIVVYQYSLPQLGFSVVKTSQPLGYRYIISPDYPFDYGEHVSVRVQANDNAGNTLDATYYFNTGTLDLILWPSSGFVTGGDKFTVTGDNPLTSDILNDDFSSTSISSIWNTSLSGSGSVFERGGFLNAVTGSTTGSQAGLSLVRTVGEVDCQVDFVFRNSLFVNIPNSDITLSGYRLAYSSNTYSGICIKYLFSEKRLVVRGEVYKSGVLVSSSQAYLDSGFKSGSFRITRIGNRSILWLGNTIVLDDKKLLGTFSDLSNIVLYCNNLSSTYPVVCSFKNHKVNTLVLFGEEHCYKNSQTTYQIFGVSPAGDFGPVTVSCVLPGSLSRIFAGQWSYRNEKEVVVSSEAGTSLFLVNPGIGHP